jgi:hypothetical protein
MTQSPVEDPAQEQELDTLTGDGQSRWHWISDRRSAENNEISVLAIIETILAGFLAYLFYRWTDTLWHVGVSACLSPLLLLRTPRSTKLSLRSAEEVYRDEFTFGTSPWYKESWGILGVILTPILVGSIKLTSTLFSVSAHPIESIAEIPRNWVRVVLCTDIGAIPELIPTIEQVPEDSPLAMIKSSRILPTLKTLLIDYLTNITTKHVVDNRNTYRAVVCYGFSFYFAIILLMLAVLLPGLVYRYAVKSTALIWSPLLWVVRPVSSPKEIKLLMNRIMTRAIYKATRLFSAVVALAFIGKIYIWLRSGDIQSTLMSPATLNAARAFIVPDQLPLWHVTSAFNSVASWGLYFLSDYYYKDWQQGVQIPETTLRYTFLWLPLIMNIFTIYSLICTVYITVQVTSNLDLPPLHAKLFPWW